MSKKLVIFGTGVVADVAYSILRKSHNIVAFCVDDAYYKSGLTKNELPVYSLNYFIKNLSNIDTLIFVAVGYHNLNQVREEKIRIFKSLGYSQPICVSEHAYIADSAEISEGCLVMPGAVIEPFVRVKRNTIIWSNVVIGHHSEIHHSCWIAANTTIGGSVEINELCFIGLGAVVCNSLSIGKSAFIGASTLVSNNVNDESVLISEPTKIAPFDSATFSRFNGLI